jgi:hypothetical protein
VVIRQQSSSEFQMASRGGCTDWLLGFWIMLVLGLGQESQCQPPDAFELLKLRQYLGDTLHVMTDNWTDPNMLWNWKGVTTNKDKDAVVSLSLPSSGLNGVLSEEVGYILGNLTHLVHLDLSDNSLTGSILTNAKTLETINLSHNYLSGSIGPDIQLIANLSELYVTSNNLNGSIPETLTQCQNLSKLDLSSNHFQGEILGGLGELRHLQLLNLSHNFFSGAIPPELGSLASLSQLQSLDLSYNNLTGTIPDALVSILHLDVGGLNVSNNQLVGQIPKALSSSPQACFNGNLGLCGLPLPPCGQDVGPTQSPGRPPTATSILLPMGSQHLRTWVVLTIAIGVAFLCLMLVSAIFLRRGWVQYQKAQVLYSPESLSLKSALPGMLFDDSLKDWMQFEDVVTATLSSSNIISAGRFTTLYKAMLPSGEMMAVKVLNFEKGYSTSHYKKVCMQLESWVHEFHHKHLMMPIGFILYDNSILLLYDDAPYASIGQSLHTKVQPNVLNTWTSRYRLALGAAQGLAYLHHSCEPPIIHLDITSHNIFLCGTPSTLHAQLGDAELLKLVEASNGTLDSISAVAGSVGYIAPGQFPLCFHFCAYYSFFPCVNVSILSKSSKPFVLSPITILTVSSVCLVWDFHEVSLDLCGVKILCPLTSGFIKEKLKARGPNITRKFSL